MSSAYEIGGNDGVPYVPVEEILLSGGHRSSARGFCLGRLCPWAPSFRSPLGSGKNMNRWPLP
jgi:hypothetical protein